MQQEPKPSSPTGTAAACSNSCNMIVASIVVGDLVLKAIEIGCIVVGIGGHHSSIF
jgi:hypothetical protein